MILDVCWGKEMAMKHSWFSKNSKDRKTSPEQYREHELLVALKEAHEEVLALQAKVGEYEWLEEALRRRTREFNERVKELTCLYAISSCLTRRELTLEQKCERMVKEMPRGWQHPHTTGVRLILHDREYSSPCFRQTQPKQSAIIDADGKHVGMLEVCLLPRASQDSMPPFLHEEQDLLNTIALWIGEIVSHTTTEGSRCCEARYHRRLGAMILSFKNRVKKEGRTR